MGPIDPRLLREASGARWLMLLTAGLGALTSALVVAQALLLARVITAVVMEGQTLDDVWGTLWPLAGIATARAVVAGIQERFGHRAATEVVRELRSKVLHHAVSRIGAGSRAEDQLDGAALTTLVTRGLDALDGYLTRYLPQLLLTAILTPAVLAVIWWQDTIAGLTILVTLPLVPLFMALVGLSTQATADRSLSTLQRLGTQVLDLIAGLPTLRVLGRAGQAARVRSAGEAHRQATMSTLRSAFLSALVLEVLTTLSVALVAVGIGLRLVSGDLGLETGLAVLLLTPEVYAPLKAVGTQFHASVDGLAAASQVFAELERPAAPAGGLTAPAVRRTGIRFEDVDVVHPGAERATPAALTTVVRPGEIVALTGPSGCGKSTAVAALMGLARPVRGRIVLSPATGDDVDLADVEPRSWWRQIAWVPQHPALVPGTVAHNARMWNPDATDEQIRAAARLTGLDDALAGVPGGWSATIGQGGWGLSAGQRQRLALTRALLSEAPLVILDEPTAHLDAGAEPALLDVLRRLRDQGRTVVVVAHRTSLAACADRVVEVRDDVAARSSWSRLGNVMEPV